MNLSRIDLNLLLVLHALLEDPSVARTARRLKVTSPAISNALSRLRGILKDPLFVRSGRGVVPTPYALELGPGLARAMRELELLVDSAEQADPATTTRTLRLALADSEQIARLPRLVRAFTQHLPRARLDVISIDTLVSRGGLEAGAADAAIGPRDAANGLHCRLLFEERGIFVIRRGHPFLRKKGQDNPLTSLRHVDVHIALGKGGVGHRAASTELKRHDIVRDIAVTVPTFAAAAVVAATTDLVAGVPEGVVHALSSTAPLVPLGHAMRFPMHLIWHERTAADPICSAFRALIVETLASAGEGRRKRRA